MGIDILTSPALLDNDEVYTNAPLFGDEPLFETLSFEKLNVDNPGFPLNPPSLQSSPDTPDSASSVSPGSSTRGRSKKSIGKQATKTPRRKSAPTGTRKNVTPESLIPVDAPIQDRKYASESATSRKELPAVFARKRKRTSAELDDEEEDILAAPPTVAELSAIETKRRQNTLAARRSRKRKLEYQRELESAMENERAEKDAWKQRALALEAILNSNGICIPAEHAIQRM